MNSYEADEDTKESMAASGSDPKRAAGERSWREQEGNPGPTLENLLVSGEVHPVVVKALVAAKQEVEEAKERMLRAVADADNQKKRLAKEQADSIRFANEVLLNQMLGVLDNLELCLMNTDAKTTVQDLKKGVEMTFSAFRQAVQSAGAEPIPAEVGAPFDPNIQEAVFQEPSALPAQTITRVVQTGFRYRERVLRPAKVAVSSGTPSSA
jgi:molecular chaperone GrpE